MYNLRCLKFIFREGGKIEYKVQLQRNNCVYKKQKESININKSL